MNKINLTNAEKKAIATCKACLANENSIISKNFNHASDVSPELYALAHDLVNNVRGRAMVIGLASVMDSMMMVMSELSSAAANVITDINNAPYGSITKTFENEEYANAVTDILYHMFMLDYALHRGGDKACEMLTKANKNE